MGGMNGWDRGAFGVRPSPAVAVAAAVVVDTVELSVGWRGRFNKDCSISSDDENDDDDTDYESLPLLPPNKVDNNDDKLFPSS